MPFRSSYRFCFSSSLLGRRCQNRIGGARDVLQKMPVKIYSQEEPSDPNAELNVGEKEYFVRRVKDCSAALIKSYLG